MTVDTFVFDLDGTLVDTAPDLIAATNHVLGTIDVKPVADDALHGAIGFGARHMIAEALNLNHRAASSQELDSLLCKFLAYYTENIAVRSRPYDGLVAVLGRLRDKGARLAVCTNKREALSLKLLRSLNMARWFHGVAGRDTLPVFKPDPGHVLGAIALANGCPDRAVMIGDSTPDIQAAKAANIPSVAVTFGYSPTPAASLGADAVIDHYDQLEGVLNGLLRPSS